MQNLIWKNVTGLKPGEVANLDFDPLFNAQDYNVARFHIGTARKQKDDSTWIVPVTFKNYGHPNRVLFYLHCVGGKWKIADIDYGSGQSLVKRLSLVW